MRILKTHLTKIVRGHPLPSPYNSSVPPSKEKSSTMGNDIMVQATNQSLQMYQALQQAMQIQRVNTQVNARIDKMENMFIKFMKKDGKNKKMTKK